jgi:hypothetical protein
MFNHGNIHLPSKIDRILRYLVVTPDMHRVHHSVVIRETNSNYGFNLPWWDRLFGTYLTTHATACIRRSVAPTVLDFCNPCVGAWTPAPQCPSNAFARFFPKDRSLTRPVATSGMIDGNTVQNQLTTLGKGFKFIVYIVNRKSADLISDSIPDVVCFSSTSSFTLYRI